MLPDEVPKLGGEFPRVVLALAVRQLVDLGDVLLYGLLVYGGVWLVRQVLRQVLALPGVTLPATLGVGDVRVAPARRVHKVNDAARA